MWTEGCTVSEKNPGLEGKPKFKAAPRLDGKAKEIEDS